MTSSVQVGDHSTSWLKIGAAMGIIGGSGLYLFKNQWEKRECNVLAHERQRDYSQREAIKQLKMRLAGYDNADWRMFSDHAIFQVRLRAPEKSLTEMVQVVMSFLPDQSAVSLRTENVGVGWSCFELYDNKTGLCVTFARDNRGQSPLLIAFEKYNDQQPFDERTKYWSDRELSMIEQVLATNERIQDERKSELEALGLTLYTPEASDIGWEDIAGYEDVKKEVQNTVILALKHPDVYQSIVSGTRRNQSSTNRPKAVLFEGPPGTGKTTMARAVAASVSVPLVYLPIESVMSKYYGDSEKMLSHIFDKVSELGEAIIFIDEIDALAGSRSGDMHEATRRILSVLLRQIEGFEKNRNTMVIGATNRKQDLDAALMSRFDVSVLFRLPTEHERAQIFANYAVHLKQNELATLAKHTQGMAGRDLRDICAHAERAYASKIIERGNLTKPGLPPLEEYLHSIQTRATSQSRII
eukprot:CAMPEP_0201549068 /NCGR_PEP_ID=MMETSP0173_2-20130828/5535_1 /ASSEMBLY_ACC=CAM_ASM_000268 /TAXON_ID=218659 /ORGANISM="Vexillifera sp., Strain DIVA3 564/2" /LENGTH=469 /DNA_ID=CAMNT_0047958613 /DNA_START=203 /DNA_END=1612 /DNA_ORIENTATION=+